MHSHVYAVKYILCSLIMQVERNLTVSQMRPSWHLAKEVVLNCDFSVIQLTFVLYQITPKGERKKAICAYFNYGQTKFN